MEKIKKVVAYFAMAGFFALPFFVQGATIYANDEYALSSSEVVEENLYVASGNASVAGSIIGDLILAGGNILVSGNVSEDVSVAGGNINILGQVGGDLRIAGGQILVGKNVEGDLAVAGGSVHVLPDVAIGKDILIGAGKLTVDGMVNGNARVAAGEVVINGTIKGDLNIAGAQNVKLGSKAVIEGDFDYRSNKKADIVEGAQILGETRFATMPTGDIDKEKFSALASGIAGAFLLIKVLSIMIAAVLFVLVFKKQSNELAIKATENFGKELLRGLIILIVFPITIVLLFGFLVGSSIALLGVFVFAALLILSSIFAGVILGSWVSKVLWKKQQLEVTWLNAIGGILLMSIIGIIPIIGQLFTFVFFLVSLGLFSDMTYSKIRE